MLEIIHIKNQKCVKMKKIKYIIPITLIILIFQSCQMKEYFFDVDETGDISSVSVKPFIEMIGEPIISMQIGETYTEQGVKASEVKLGDTDLQYEIVAGAVNSNEKNLYIVEYKATNSFGWASFAYRAVLVHDGTPYSREITGSYKKGNNFVSKIEKHSINGYWYISNVWQQPGYTLPVIFADMDGTGEYDYIVVPGDDPILGKYTGWGEFVDGGFGPDKINFYILEEGKNVPKVFDWTFTN